VNKRILIEYEVHAFRAKLSGASIADVNFAWQADFSESDLSGAAFKNCDLSEALFVKANLKGATFSDCILGTADFTGVDLDDKTTFTGCHYSFSQIDGPIIGHIMDANKRPLNIATFPPDLIKMNLMTVGEFAKEVRLKPQTVKVLCQYDTLKGHKHGRDWWLPRSEVDRYRKEIHGRPGHKPELVVTVHQDPEPSFSVDISVILADKLGKEKIEFSIIEMIDSHQYDLGDPLSLKAMKENLEERLKSVVKRDVSVAVQSVD